ncbi:hypothetical protein NC651_020355 [Populus alba x Populus x berolinensis]|nr:hypothetical protein NC651_020355 [Populus alba x Populus x berolinensis]
MYKRKEKYSINYSHLVQQRAIGQDWHDLLLLIINNWCLLNTPSQEMGNTRLPGFCLNRIRPRVRVRPPPIQAKPNLNSTTNDQNNENPDSVVGDQEKPGNSEGKPVELIGRKIMIVVDSSIEAQGALQWALSHTVQSQDLLILLHVTKESSKQATGTKTRKERGAPRACELVNSVKNMCQLKRPEIQIEIAVVEGKEKGPLIVEEAKKQEVALLVLGQKKRSMTWRLFMMWASNRVTGGVVEYCIQNADCMAIAVRRKSQKHGAYQFDVSPFICGVFVLLHRLAPAIMMAKGDTTGSLDSFGSPPCATKRELWKGEGFPPRTRTRFQIWTIRKGEEEKKANLILLVGPEPEKKAKRQKTDLRHCANQSSYSSFFVSSRHVWTLSTCRGHCGSLCFTNLFRRFLLFSAPDCGQMRVLMEMT